MVLEEEQNCSKGLDTLLHFLKLEKILCVSCYFH